MDHLERSDTRYDFHLLVGSGVENAMALPGGHIIFTEELMETWIDNEAQLATVVGHEIAHVERRHSAALIGYCEFLGMDPNDQISQILVGVGTLPFSSKQEEEADRVGAGMMHQSGYSVFQSVEMWEEVATRYSSESSAPAGIEIPDGLPIPGGILERGLDELENLLTTHPDSELRACRLKQVAKTLYDEAPLQRAYVGETNWRRRVPFGKTEY
jgi:Zn-dependent protease with chaperone function